MNFSEQLNSYIDQIACTSKELANVSGISAPVISRFRNDEKLPNLNSSQLENLSFGLFILAEKKCINISKDTIYSSLLQTLSNVDINMELVRTNINILINLLNINITNLSRAISFDASLISRIRSGQRNPSDPQSFVNLISNYVVHKYKNSEDKKVIATLINCKFEDLSDESVYLKKIENWIFANSSNYKNYIDDFLKNLDEFNLEQYIKTIHFDEMKVPFIPFYKINSKNYYGIEEMKQGELDFFKATVLSKSTDDIFMCSDMPMEDMAKDLDFDKKWMYAIAISLKKGLHLNIIHNLDRPFNEMMLGLESWVPIYMTGQITPYYLKGFQDNVYCHFNYVSGSVAISGECINGYHNEGKYFLTSNKSDVAYYQNKAKCLLNKAQPLMDIYKSDRKNDFNAFVLANSNIAGNRRRILSSLPIHTISNELLLKILKRNNVSNIDVKNIIESVKKEKEIIEVILKSNLIEDEIAELSKDNFDECTPILFLANSFYNIKINYNYDEYLEHLKLTKTYSKKTNNYTLKFNKHQYFRNIQITIHSKNWVMISKNSSPTIHFVIHHQKLREAIENYIPPIIE